MDYFLEEFSVCILNQNTLQLTAQALRGEWGLELPDTLSEEELLHLLSEKLANVIAQGPDAFYQLMYRLDISEKKLNAVLGDEDVPMKVARLVYDRQLQKVKSRQEHRKTHSGTEDSELTW